jgi:AcrR family transcriptional regulator
MESLTKRQNIIVRESIKLISEGGIQNFTMKSLAEKLGITEPAIYRHFSSKIDILLSMLRMIEETNRQFKIEIENSSPSLDLIENMFVRNSQLFSETPEISSIIFSEEIFQNNRILSDKVLNIMNERNRLTCKVIDDIQKTGEIRDDVSAEKLTLMIIGTLRLSISTWKLSGFNFDLTDEVQSTWKAIKTLLKKE